MKKTRKDTWSEEEDRLLANTVIEHIKSSSTQTRAFVEVGKKVSRTAQAVGFRWNSKIRKEYDKEIEEARQSKLQSKATGEPTQDDRITDHTNVSVDLSELSMEQLEVLEPLLKYLISREPEKELAKTKSEYDTLLVKYEQLQEDYDELYDEHRQFLRMVVKAQEKLVTKNVG